MDYRGVTKIFLLILIAAIAIFDSYVFIQGGTEATISHVLMSWSYAHPAFTFSIGFVCGHLFWRIRDVKTSIDKPASD